MQYKIRVFFLFSILWDDLHTDRRLVIIKQYHLIQIVHKTDTFLPFFLYLILTTGNILLRIDSGVSCRPPVIHQFHHKLIGRHFLDQLPYKLPSIMLPGLSKQMQKKFIDKQQHHQDGQERCAMFQQQVAFADKHRQIKITKHFLYLIYIIELET